MGNVGGWDPARAQVGRERGVIEDGQLLVAAETELLVLAAGVAGFGVRPDVQPAAVTMVSRISARHRRGIGQAYAWGCLRPIGASGAGRPRGGRCRPGSDGGSPPIRWRRRRAGP